MFKSCWSAPSNIAFVKYWGKKGEQLPINPSVSGTLNKCRSITKLDVLDELPGFKLKFTFDGNPSPAFESKILKKFEEYYLREIPGLNQ